jgi:hypothetical protein
LRAYVIPAKAGTHFASADWPGCAHGKHLRGNRDPELLSKESAIVLPALLLLAVPPATAHRESHTRLLGRSPRRAPIRIVTTDPRDAWLPERLLEDGDTWRGTRIAGRVHFDAVASASASDQLLFMNRDGHLHPDTSPLTRD